MSIEGEIQTRILRESRSTGKCRPGSELSTMTFFFNTHQSIRAKWSPSKQLYSGEGNTSVLLSQNIWDLLSSPVEHKTRVCVSLTAVDSRKKLDGQRTLVCWASLDRGVSLNRRSLLQPSNILHPR